MPEAPVTTPAALPAGLLRPALEGVAAYEPGRPIDEVRRELGIDSIPTPGTGAPGDRKARSALLSFVKLASNEGPFPPMPGAVAAIRAAAEGVRRYPDPGCWALRDALARRLGVEPAQVLAGAGVDGLIGLLCRATLDPGDEVAMGWPSFPSWRQGARVQGARVREVALAADGAYDLEALAGAVTARTKLVVVVSPNNPTGGAVTADALAQLLDALPGHVLPVVDEAYFEYLPPGGHDAVAHVAAGRPVAALRTFSKAYGLAGLRVGYLVAPGALVAALGRVRNVFDVSDPAQAAALASLADAGAHLPERIALNDRERARARAGLEALGLAPLASTANFLLVPLGSAERAGAVNRALLERGVIVRPAGPFGAPGALRVTIGWPEENTRLLETLAEVL